jgi:hypothetical protein
LIHEYGPRPEKEMWTSFDERHNRILAEILNELPGVQCEIPTPFVTTYYDTEAALQRAHKITATDPRSAGLLLTLIPNHSRGGLEFRSAGIHVNFGSNALVAVVWFL